MTGPLTTYGGIDTSDSLELPRTRIGPTAVVGKHSGFHRREIEMSILWIVVIVVLVLLVLGALGRGRF
jgi:uncharacterized membrane protein